MPIFGTFEHFLEFLGAVVPLCSILSSWINASIRAKHDAGAPVPRALLRTGSILNAASINLDKVVQIGRIARAQLSKKKEEGEPELLDATVEGVAELEEDLEEEAVTAEDFKALQEKVWELEISVLELKNELVPAKKAVRKKRKA